MEHLAVPSHFTTEVLTKQSQNFSPFYRLLISVTKSTELVDKDCTKPLM